jgi:hypothetical protein
MRSPDQDERADDGTVSEAFGDGFGSVDQGDLNDGYGTDDFYDDTYTEPDAVDEPVDDGSTDADDTFDDAVDDEGGFGTTDDTVVVEDDGIVVGDDGAEVTPTAAEAPEEDEPGNILEEILDDVLGGDVGDIGGEIGDTYGTDTPDFLQGLDDEDGTGLDGDSASSAINNESSDGVFDSPFDQPDGADVADFVSESDFDLNTDGHVDRGDLREAAHPFDFHADG